MSSTADQPIAALRTGHDNLVALVHDMPAEMISGPSGASEWTIAQVLSHLGSGAEIGLASLRTALGQAEQADDGFNQSVWDRWDAMAPDEQAHGFMISNEKLVRAYENIDDEARNDRKVDLGFLPTPVDLATAASFRLNEFALHAWDIAVAGDPSATVAADAAEPMMTVIPFLIGWIGKPGPALNGKHLTVAVHTTTPTTDFGLAITEKVALTDAPADPNAELTLPAESWVRLATGRLGADHTPSEVSVTGDLTLPQLREIFPGF